ncbi:FGGY-family carbohydrate kinase [uncultured Roseibium sp.]|uniref:FGGY-family carbohydrate kinase n=1 Tax=uncultured Roseibium sp. TaxID=1936171 RepID=UPI0026139F13|nr:FGGY-family carbohydrate kinase [uncultured Roseibium sp.]
MTGRIRHVGVIDIGKTNLKVAVVDLVRETEIGVLTRPNRVLPGPPYPHFDLESHWNFVCDALYTLNGRHGIEALSVTTHGASGVLLNREGDFAAPMLDYECDGPDAVAAEYDLIRPDFDETGSPRLAMGLNLGAQLYWQLKSDPDLLDRIATVLTYPQYWTYRLTGVLANEVTSLGCHTDLWSPAKNRYSALVAKLGLTEKMAPVKKAGDRIGKLLPRVAERTGLAENTPVVCGLHDSNASLYPHLLRRTPPFSVVSTGTWVIALAVGGDDVVPDPHRDTLINVNAFGDPVPSARFMGGREFDLVMKGRNAVQGQAGTTRVLRDRIMLFPAVEPRSGPFQGQVARWSIPEEDLTDGERYAAVSFYLAMMTSECPLMTGAQGPVIVEGPFAKNALYLEMLEAATQRTVHAPEGIATGTSIGAALLFGEQDTSRGQTTVAEETGIDPKPELRSYAGSWRDTVRASLK